MIVEKSIRNIAFGIIAHFAGVNPNGVGWSFTYEQCIDVGDFYIILNLN